MSRFRHVCFLAAMLAPAWVSAAPGDPGAAAVSADGTRISFALEAMNGAALTGLQPGAAVVVSAASQGFDGAAAPAAVPRQFAAAFASAEGATPALVTLTLAEPIHAGDSAVVLSLPAGAFHDGTVASAAAAALPVANNSQLAYARPVCLIVSEGLVKHNGAFYVDVYAAAGAYAGHAAQLGIAAVSVSVTDAAGAAVTRLTGELALIDRIGDFGWQPRWQAFRIGPFNPAPGGDWGGGGAAQGLARVAATAYPRIGGAESPRTSPEEALFLDPAGAYAVRHAVVDATAGANATGRIALGDGGFAQGIAAVDDTAAENPFRDAAAAIAALQRGDGVTPGPDHGKASWSVVYLREGSHVLGGYDYALRSDTRDGPVILTKAPGAARGNVVVTGSGDSCGLRTHALWLDNLRIAGAKSPVLRSAGPLYEPGPLGGGATLKLRHCELIGPGRTVTAFTHWTDGFDRVLAYAIACSNAFAALPAVRDSSYWDIGGDALTAVSDRAFVNHLVSVNASGTGTKAQTLRLYGGAENVALHTNRFHGLAEAGPAPALDARGAAIRSLAMTMNVFDDGGPGNIANAAADSWFLYHNAWAAGLTYKDDGAMASFANVWIARNYFASLTAAGAAPPRTGVNANHNAAASGVLDGFGWTSGGLLAEHFADWTAGDYTPVAAALLARWTEPILPYDAAGFVMPASGAIGPIQPGAGAAPDTTPPVPGTIAGAPQYINQGPLGIAYAGASDTGSGLAQVELWARKGDGPWQATGVTNPAPSGVLAYGAFSGEGVYAFALRAADLAGNLSPAPSGNGTVQVVLDATPPSGGTVAAAPYYTAGPIEVAYSGVSDSASGVASVRLWAKKDDGAWADTGLVQSGPSAAFAFPPAQGDGVYRFAIQPVDGAGNAGPIPTGSGQASVTLDGAPPLAGALSGPAAVTAGPVSFAYSGAADALSGFHSVTLWVRPPSGLWAASAAVSVEPAGVLEFSGLAAQGLYEFALVARDNAGNLSPLPNGVGMTSLLYDAQAPSPGTVSLAGAHTNAAPIAVAYSGVADAVSGIAEVRLWAKRGTGAWTDTGLTSTQSAGAFAYAPAQGDGVYAFALVARDNAGNATAAPSGSGQASVTYDTAVPVAGSLSGPALAAAGPVSLAYTGASDALSGLKTVRLWVKKPGSGWTASGLSSTLASGGFAYTDFSTPGVYAFAVQSEDRAGNLSTAPSGSGQHSLTFDAAAPLAPTLVSAPAVHRESPIPITYSGASDGLSGLKRVILWVRKDAGAWSATSVTATAAEGQLNYAAMTGDGLYRFAVQSEDLAGNLSAAPTGDGQTSTNYDATAPALATVTAPAYAAATPISIAFAAEAGTVEGTLWVKRGAGAWTDTGAVIAASSGAFEFDGVSGDGVYAWAVRTRDAAGNVSPAPAGAGSASTVFDATPPSAAAVTAPAFAAAAPVSVGFSGAADAGSGIEAVQLWVKAGAGPWTDSGVASVEPSGTFAWPGPGQDGVYTLAARVLDKAGNLSSLTGAPVAAVTFDAAPPLAGTVTAPASASAAPIAVSYAGAADAGSGLDAVELWAGVDGAPLSATGLTSASGSGTFAYTPTADGEYAFALRAADKAGNLSAVPVQPGGAVTVFDSTPPSGAAVGAPAYATAAPVSLTYSAAPETVTARLWVRKESGGAWLDTGQTESGPNGAFSFASFTGDGRYDFAVQTEDGAGNRSPDPAGPGAASLIFDTAAPAGGVISAPAYGALGPIALTYSGVEDGLAGVARVRLFASKDGGPWSDTGVSGAAASGSLAFTPAQGQGVYAFALQGEDRAGNVASAPTGPGLASTAIDATAPAGGTLTVPAYAAQAPIAVAYGGLTDAGGSGLDSVELWVRKGQGAWAFSGLAASEPEGAFAFNGLSGDGTYRFAIVAEDKAGNRSPEPTGEGLGATVFDLTPPGGFALSAPAYGNTAAIALSFGGATDSGAGLKRVRLWVRKGAGGWTATIYESTQAAGAFTFTGLSGDDRYYFALQAEDMAGNLSAAPSGDGAASTLVDTVAPAAGTLTASASFDASSPIDLVYSGVSDGGAGIQSVTLWARRNGGAWAATPNASAAAFGAFPYVPAAGDGKYDFALVAEDKAGNRSAVPSGEGAVSVTFDATAPSIGVVTAPEFASQNPIAVAYTGAADAGSGLDEVQLYVRKDAGAWTEASSVAPLATASGSFSYTAAAGDGAYHFALRVKDKAGNESPMPTGSGAAITRYDTAPPVLGTLTAPAYLKAAPATLTYTGVNDAGSGLKNVRLWMRKDNGAWGDTGLVQTASSGAFAFNAFAGDGVYRFALQAEDMAGGKTPAPSGGGAAAIIFDTQPPSVGALQAPPTEDNAPINVIYSGVADAGSGIDKVALWFAKDGGPWTDSGLWSAGASGVFGFTAVTGDGAYAFALRAADRAGNLSPVPSGAGQATTLFDASFTPGTLTAPAYAVRTPIIVEFAGAQSPGGAPVTVHLWVRKGAEGVWARSGLSADGNAGQFAYAAMTGDDAYYFALQADDGAGRLSPEPFGDGDGRTIFDTTPPEPLVLVSPPYAKAAPIPIDFAAEEETGSGVKQSRIWVKKSVGGAWEDTGLQLNGTAGSFLYEDLPQDGVYYFYLQVEDNAGLTSPPPSDDLVFMAPP